VSVVGGGDAAFRSPAKNAVAIASNQVIAGVSKRAWQHAGGESEGPNPTETIGDA